ncbi:hypothetical protein QZH41_001233 [Actinostola sp. cb2023]|nr:hypothetical protein QZH41_001233 [Actinostola sp. cb2023]
MRSSASKEVQQELSNCVSCQNHVVLIAFCPQCGGMICAECMNAHKTLKVFVDEHKATMFADFKKEHVNSYIKNQVQCQEKFHEKNELEYYCQTCLKCICQKCASTTHTTHDKVSVEEAADEVKVIIKRDMDRVNKVKENYVHELELCKQNIKRIEHEVNAAKKKVHDEVEAQINILKDHENSVIKTLDKIFLEQKTTNIDEESEINTGIKQISEFHLRGQTLQDQNVAHFILQSQQELPQRCETLLERPFILSSQPATKRNESVQYIPNPRQQLGKIVEGVTDPSRCEIQSLNNVRRGFINEFKIVTRNSEGQAWYTNKGDIGVQIQDDDGHQVQNEVIEIQTGIYIVKYRAEKSSYKIMVSIGEKSIKNSPQNVKPFSVKSLQFKPMKIFSSFGKWDDMIGRSKLNSPFSLAVSDSGEIAITEFGNHRIVVFSVDGKNDGRAFYGGKLADDSHLRYPWGVVFNGDHLVVNDHPDNIGRIQEFNFSGTYLRTIYKQERVSLRGMCMTDENIAVCCKDLDEETQSGIKIFSKESGQLVQEIPCIDQDEVPKYIAYGDGKYFVSYGSKNYIRVFNTNGSFLYKVGKKGDKNGQFNSVSGLAVFGGVDVILVCDADNHRVQAFTRKGQFLRSFGSQGSNHDQMDNPTDVVVTHDGNILVLEWQGGRVSVWQS